MILQPTSETSHHHKVTNITMPLTSLSPHFWRCDFKSVIHASFFLTDILTDIGRMFEGFWSIKKTEKISNIMKKS